jgi:hypothetical protein
MNFPCQVVLVHGDSHYFEVDKPINLPSGGVLANFTRVETFGARQTHWVSATIDPSDPNLFQFEPRIVAADVGKDSAAAARSGSGPRWGHRAPGSTSPAS